MSVEITFSLLLIIMSVNYSHGVPVYKATRYIPRSQMLKESPKQWRIYIDKYLALLIQTVHLPDKNIQSFFFFQLNCTTYFIEKSKAVLPLYFYTYGSTIRRISGKMLLHSKDNKLWSKYYLQYIGFQDIYHFAATFITDKRLSLNITVHDLFFSSGTVNCETGSLSIFELKLEKVKHRSLLYCGFHSEFNIYPGTNMFSIVSSVHSHILMFLHAVFYVTDSNLLKTFPAAKQSHTIPVSIWNVHENYTEISLFIQISKCHKVKLQLSQTYFEWHLVYNGPGQNSAILNPDNVNKNNVYLYSCSSFQCFVDSISNRNETIFVNYSSVQLETKLRKEINSTKYVTLFGSDCNSKPCIVVLHAQHDFQVNVTIVGMSYKSRKLHSPDCRYGGLVLKEDLTENEKETPPFCQNHSAFTQVSRSYFSSNSTLVMVFYIYEEYSKMNVTLKLSQTKCKPVVLSFYDLQLFCHHKYHNDCGKYLEQITQGTSLLLSQPNAEFYNIIFSMSKEECVIIHISMKMTHLYKLLKRNQKDHSIHDTFHSIFSAWIIALTAESINSFGVKFNYQITGTIAQSLSSEFRPEELTFISIDETEQFCFNQFTQSHKNSFICRKLMKRLTCEGNVGCKAINQEIKASESNDTAVVAKAITETPLELRKFKFHFSFHKHSESWVDIVILKTTFDNREEKCGTECQFLSQTIDLSVVQNKTEFNVNKLYSQNDSMLLLTIDSIDTDLYKMSGDNLEVYIRTEINPRNDVVLRLKYPMSYWELVHGKMISLPKQIDGIVINLDQPLSSDISAKFNVMWLHDNYIKHFKNPISLLTDSRKCYTNVEQSALGYKACLNVSFIDNPYHYILYSKEFAHYHFERLEEPSGHTSWREASELCRGIGGYLPYFTSREGLDELLAWLKLSPDIYPIEALYIGLTWNPVVICLTFSSKQVAPSNETMSAHTFNKHYFFKISLTQQINRIVSNLLAQF